MFVFVCQVVGVKVVINVKSFGFRCYGFVIMLIVDEVFKCIQYLYRIEFYGKMIFVERVIFRYIKFLKDF